MVLVDSEKFAEQIEGLAAEIAALDSCDGELALVGIQTRGVHIAERISKIISELKGHEVLTGKIDVTMFRDDISRRPTLPKIKETSIGFDIDGKRIVLIDDVLFTGRTVKAAIEDITSFGRPEYIRLAVVADRGHREMPIQPDFCAMKIETSRKDKVSVRMTETDGEDCIELNC